MQQNWYAVYTKLHCERKVSLLLTKKKIENFCPLNYKVTKGIFRKIVSVEPVFNTYVFVKCTAEEITGLSKLAHGIISILYWKGEPATIKESEINSIREFTSKQLDIKVEKLKKPVENSEAEKVNYYMSGQVVRVLSKPMRLDLPSLGLTMFANVKEATILGNQLINNETRALAN